MNRSSVVSFLVLSLFLTAASFAEAAPEFKIKEFKEFHDVLHPLEHESMPKKDYEAIRNQTEKLVHLGHAIVQLGAPRGLSHVQVQEYEAELENFGRSLKKLASAKDGKDLDVKYAFSAVHDSFERLAAMLPRE